MIKITESRYLNGMPNMDYAIDVNGIRISLKKEDFKELTEKLSETLKDDYQKATTIKEKYDKNVKQIQELRRDLIGIFWSGDQDDLDSFFFKREVKEIDQEKLWQTLEKYNRFLGFE